MNSVFESCANITSFDFRNAKKVAYAMFKNCQNLVSLNMENVISFAANAVANCPKLESIYLPICNSISYVETNMYQSNKALRTV